MTHFFPREILDEDLVEEMARLKHRSDVPNLSKITKYISNRTDIWNLSFELRKL